LPIPQYTKPTISLGIFEETPLSPSPTSTSTIDPDLEQIFFIDLPPPSRATCIEVGRPGMDWFGELNLGAKYGYVIQIENVESTCVNDGYAGLD
jgi:hypothetical protein